METINQPIDYKQLYEYTLKTLETVNALYIELHKKVMDTNPEIILTLCKS